MQFRALVLVLGIILGAGELRAQPAPALPAGMTQEQFDMLVDAISKSVVEKMKAEGGPAATPEPAKAKPNKGAPPLKAQVVHIPKQGPGEFALLLQRFGKAVAAYPVLGQQLAALGRGLDQRENGGWGAGAFAVIVVLVAAAAVGAEWALRGLLGSARRRLAARAGPEHGISSLANLAALVALDAVGLLAVWLICNAAGALFSSGTVQDTFAEAVFAGIFAWRLYMLLIRIVLQPDMQPARLCDIDRDRARTMYRQIALVMLVIIVGRIVGRVLVTMDTPAEALAAYQIVGTTIAVTGLLWIVFGSREAARQWLGGLATAAAAGRRDRPPLAGRGDVVLRRLGSNPDLQHGFGADPGRRGDPADSQPGSRSPGLRDADAGASCGGSIPSCWAAHRPATGRSSPMSWRAAFASPCLSALQ